VNSEDQFLAWMHEAGQENLQSACMKCELGMGTPEEQMLVIAFLHQIRNLLGAQLFGESDEN
jgi:hypothetical protein